MSGADVQDGIFSGGMAGVRRGGANVLPSSLARFAYVALFDSKGAFQITSISALLIGWQYV